MTNVYLDEMKPTTAKTMTADIVNCQNNKSETSQTCLERISYETRSLVFVDQFEHVSDPYAGFIRPRLDSFIC